MSELECDVGQVIVVVETPSAELESDAKRQDTVSGNKTITQINVKADKIQRNSRKWELLEKLPSTASFNQWLKRKAAAGLKYSRKKTTTVLNGATDYYYCTGVGCPVQLEVLFPSSSEDVIVSYNGRQHRHNKKPHSGWGLPEKTKKEVHRLFQAGITRVTEMDSRLRKQGHSEYSLKQLVGYLNRLRRRSRDQEVSKEYTELSVWSGGDRSFTEESRVVEESEDGSPPPAGDGDSELSDSAPPASPLRRSTTDRHDRRPRRPKPAMDEGTVRRLVDASIAARGHSYSPYSQFPVGAALLCPDGQIVSGCNVENASFGLTNCAERTAVFKAVSEGRRQFTAVAIAAEMGDTFVGPCGACRQVLAEFNAEMPVILAKPNGDISRTSMKELLPMAFLPDDVTFKKA